LAPSPPIQREFASQSTLVSDFTKSLGSFTQRLN
jgi:hypothetical protein